MNNSGTNGTPEDDGEERGDLIWNEFDWERYLREQDETVVEYQRCYDSVGDIPDRLDEVARLLDWELDPLTDDDAEPDDGEEDDDFDEDDCEPYTLHRNPVYIATRALFSSVQNALERTATGTTKIPVALSVSLASALHRTELTAMLGINALDLGDHALGISQLKRALAELNGVFARLPAEPGEKNRDWQDFRNYALPRLFDLRDIWLRVVQECRDALEREINRDDAS